MVDREDPTDGAQDDAPTGDRHEAVGTVAEEAAKFLRAVYGDDRCPTCGGPAAGSGSAWSRPSAARSDGDHDAGAPNACRRCPICQATRFARRVRPDTLDNLAQAVSLFGTALSELAVQLRDDARSEDAEEAGDRHREDTEAEDIVVRDGSAPDEAAHPRTEEGR